MTQQITKRSELEPGEIELDHVQDKLEELRAKKKQLENPVASQEILKPPPAPKEAPPTSSSGTSRSRTKSRSRSRRRKRRRRSGSRSRSRKRRKYSSDRRRSRSRRPRRLRSYSRARRSGREYRRRRRSRDRDRGRATRSGSRPSNDRRTVTEPQTGSREGRKYKYEVVMSSRSGSSDRRGSNSDRRRQRSRDRRRERAKQKKLEEEAEKLRRQQEEEQLKRQLAVQQLQEWQRAQQMQAIREAQEELFRQQEKKKKENQLKQFAHQTALKLKEQKLTQMLNKHKKHMQEKFQEKLEQLQLVEKEKKPQKDEYGVLIPEKPKNDAILQAINVLVPYIVDYGEKLLPLLRARLEKDEEGDESFQFLAHPGIGQTYFNYLLDKMQKNRKKKQKTRFGPKVVNRAIPKPMPLPAAVRQKAATMMQPYNVQTRKTFTERKEGSSLYNPFTEGNTETDKEMYDPFA